jgi:predicted component of viral defense system (DUF524 family)
LILNLRRVVIDLGGPPSASARLEIALLPNAREDQVPWPLVNLEKTAERDTSLEPIQLLEGSEYRYRFVLGSDANRITTDRPEIFYPDDDDGYAGRLRPGLHVGRLPVRVAIGDVELSEIAFEVRSRKLDYLTQYRWMLRDIAEFFTQAIMERFAATEEEFAIDEKGDAKTLYERFAFLKALLQDDQFQSAIRLVLARPYVAWSEEAELRSPSRGIRFTSRLSRELVRPGPRLEEMVSSQPGVTWPKKLNIFRTEESLDNVPNQFVKFALTKWRAEVFVILRLLDKETGTSAVERGIRETKQVIQELDQLLGAPLFADVSAARTLPTANPVLLRKEGYREILRAFIQFEMAARLAWEGGESVYGAGQRNVATLYEYWCFLQLYKVVSELCSMSVETGDLFQVRSDGLNLLLARGRETLLRGTTVSSGRKLNVELCFNRSFPGRATSWSKHMRPDCSIRISDFDALEHDYRTVWIHFDAKYKAEQLVDVFGDDTNPESQTETKVATRDDLLKMHAYRDSIRRSAGAYVLYPGDTDEQFFQYHELLPGLGAFALRPTENGEARGINGLRTFLLDVLQHAGSQYTQYERGRYWNDVSFLDDPTPLITGYAAPFLTKPPKDIRVLVGYTKSKSQFDWVLQHQLYNLRADETRNGAVTLESDALASDYILLYGDWSYQSFLYRIAGPSTLLLVGELLAMNYPNPSGTKYLCIPIAQASLPFPIGLGAINRLRKARHPGDFRGTPFTISWADLVQEIENPTSPSAEPSID